ADERDKDLAKWYQISGLISMFIYFVLSLQVYSSYKKLVYQLLSYADSVLFEWIKRFLLSFLLMQIARLVFLFLLPDWGSFPLKWWYYLIFAALFYYIAIAGYSSTEKPVIPLSSSSPAETENDDLGGTVAAGVEIETSSDASHKMTSELIQLKEKIEQLMISEKAYRDPQLALGDLATKLNTNPRNISQAINRGFDMNFNDYINYHRVEAVKQSMEDEEHTQHTLLAIALDSGFNSKATFNRAFKKHTTFTPQKYLSNKTK
ncbi:MAG: helix-turn-helix domain-containing protein, partial [Calditrichota bacterium]